jgi:hypothetical protein
MFSSIPLEERVPLDHHLRVIGSLSDKALAGLNLA